MALTNSEKIFVKIVAGIIFYVVFYFSWNYGVVPAFNLHTVSPLQAFALYIFLNYVTSSIKKNKDD